MPDVHALFDSASIDALSQTDLYARYEQLKAELGPNPGAVADDAKLHEMVVILGALRRKSAGPPRRGSANGTSRGKVEPGVNDL